MPGARTLIQTAIHRIALHPYYFIAALGLLFYTLVLATTAWMVWNQRLLAIDQADANLRTLSVALAEQADRVIASVDAAGTHLLDHVLRGHIGTSADASAFLESQQLQATLTDIVSATPERYEFFLVDEHGQMLNFSHQWPTPKINVADRPYFQFARAHPEITTFISEALLSRYSGNLVFNLVRRLSGPDGAFKGVLIGTIQSNYLRRIFRAATLSDQITVELFHSDGALLVRYPSLPGDAHWQDALRRASFAGTDQVVLRDVDPHDQTEQRIAVSRLPHRPLVIMVSQPVGNILVTWRLQTAWIGAIVTFGCLATVLIIVLVVRRFSDQQRLADAALAWRLEEERRRVGRETADQHAVFGMALDNMNEGLLMFDRSDRLLLANAAVMRIMELRPGALRPGMPVADVIAAVANVGNISADITAVIRFYARLLERNVPAKFIRTLPDGRQLAANFAPHDNGWIITYEDMTEVRKADERIAHMAMHDTLTGLPNRGTFRIRTEQALAAIRDGGSFAIACVDLDNFKNVNDTFGHPVGDKLLCEVVKRLQIAMRPTDIVARLGGDEFAIVLNNVTSKVAIASMATRLIEAVSAPYDLDGQTVFAGASIGIAIATMDGDDPDTLIRNAAMAMYRAKSAGRGRFAFFDPSMEQHVIERHRIGHELHNALSAGDLDLYYQPIVTVADRRIVGFEALMRWRHPTRGMIPPSEFIPVAEENGFIVQLGRWALDKACLEAMLWPADLKLAVNLSPVQFRSGTLVQAVAEALRTAGLPASRLELEITESTMMIDTDATLATLRELKALKVRIAMDDFGTGYSSLAYLQRFPFDKIKIDRAFVRDIAQATNLAIISAVTGIAESLDIATTAEGVETEEQFNAVKRLRCQEAQGYLFSQPCPAQEIPAMLALEKSRTQQGKPALAAANA